MTDPRKGTVFESQIGRTHTFLITWYGHHFGDFPGGQVETWKEALAVLDEFFEYRYRVIEEIEGEYIKASAVLESDMCGFVEIERVRL